jgi:hypothetical protein
MCSENQMLWLLVLRLGGSLETSYIAGFSIPSAFIKCVYNISPYNFHASRYSSLRFAVINVLHPVLVLLYFNFSKIKCHIKVPFFF